MRVLVVCAVVASFYFIDAMPFNDILADLGASRMSASGSGGQKVIPEVVADFEGLGSRVAKSSKKSEDIDDSSSSQSLSGSGESYREPRFRESNNKETDNQSSGETAQQDEPDDQEKSISGSGIDSAGANFWPVVRIEPGANDRGSDRELHLIRRSETSIPDSSKRASNDGSSVTISEPTSGEQLAQRSDAPTASRSGEDLTSGEDDAPFDTSSTDSESDSGCSSGYGCYESEGEQGGDGGGINSRSVISRAEERAGASGSASGDFAPNEKAWVQPHFDVTAGPYDDEASGSGSDGFGSEGYGSKGSGSEGSGSKGSDSEGIARLKIAFPENASGFGKEDAQPETDLHEIEDAIFDSGIPLVVTSDTSSGSGSGSGSGSLMPSPPEIKSFHDSEASASGSSAAEKVEGMQLFVAPQHHQRISLMEKMMKLGKLQAIKITHHTVGASSRNEVPRVKAADDNSQMLSDLGQGRKVSFVLNQDFHSGYANENSAAYNILANNVKQEVENTLGSNAVVSEIAFSEVREPISHSPRFSKVMVSFKLLGDVAKLEKKVKKGMISGLVVDKTFFHDAP